jgi:iron(III) transport system substrate-binding protein
MARHLRVRASRVFGALVASALVVAACGGDDDDDAGGDTAAPGATAAPAATQAPADTATGTSAPTTGGDTTAAEGTEPTGTEGATRPTEVSSDEWDSIVAAANEEGTVTLYTAQGLDQANQLKAAFEAEYPDITLEIVRDISSNLIPKIEAERQTGNGIADVYVSADTAWWETTAAGGFIIPMVGPAFSDPEYDPALIHADTYFEPSAVVFGFGWNTNEVPDGLSAMTDVINPEFEGKIGVVEPSLEALVDFWKYLEEEYGEEFVTQLADLNPRIYPGAGPLREALASGEIAVSTYNSPMPDLVAQGAPVDWTIPETAWGARFYGGIVDTAPHPNAAQVLSNFMITRPGQESLVFNESVAVLPDIPGTGAEIGAVRVAPKYTPEEIAEYQEYWRGLFQS